jgi:hypothetical protein
VDFTDKEAVAVCQYCRKQIVIPRGTPILAKRNQLALIRLAGLVHLVNIPATPEEEES